MIELAQQTGRNILNPMVRRSDAHRLDRLLVGPLDAL
jgi:hypothetical protein